MIALLVKKPKKIRMERATFSTCLALLDGLNAARLGGLPSNDSIVHGSCLIKVDPILTIGDGHFI